MTSPSFDEIHDFHAEMERLHQNHPIEKDPKAKRLVFVAFLAIAMWGAWDIGSRVIPCLFQDAGTLTGCEALNAEDCVAFAQGGL